MRVLALAALFLAVGCASKRPVLYPNQRLQEVGAAGAELDIDTCIEYAASQGETANPAGRTAASTARGAASGAAVGAASGAVRGNAGRGAATWAAGGGAAGFMRGLFRWRDPDPIQRAFVNECLHRMGYRPLGWR